MRLMSFFVSTSGPRKPVPRGVRSGGWPILSYGFRPFFLLAGVWAIAAMALWLGFLIAGWQFAGPYGALNWHAHELLFGYVSAALAGFMLTAIPNWTGRLPVAGLPLLALVLIWMAGRAAMLMTGQIGIWPAIAVEAAFLPVLAAVAAREVGSGQNWRNLHVVTGVGLLALANFMFHINVAGGGDTGLAYRLAILGWLMLITLIGGRLAVSFTHNWLSRRGVVARPESFGRYDRVAIVLTLGALVAWVMWPTGPVTASLCGLAALVQLGRLLRWRGWLAWREPLVWVLHTSYLFIPLGLASLTASGLGWIGPVTALHVLTVGAITNMTFAVMTRASRGHTGRPLAASAATAAAYLALIGSAIVRPLVDFLPGLYLEVLAASGLLWFLAFSIFIAEYGPMLVTRRK